MIRTVRGFTIALTVTATLLAGCTGQGEPGTESAGNAATTSRPVTDDPTTTESGDYRYRVPAEVRAAFFGGATPAAYRHWEPRLSSDDAAQVTIRQRRLPGCDTRPWLQLDIDQGARDFASVIRDTGTGFVVARQLTVYDDAATAKQLVPQMDRRSIGCLRYAGRGVASTQVGEFTPDRFFGITANHDGTMFSNGYNATAVRGANWVDVVTRENNAVVLTRIADLAYEGNPNVITRKAKERRFVAEVRKQGTISARTLNAFD